MIVKFHQNLLSSLQVIKGQTGDNLSETSVIIIKSVIQLKLTEKVIISLNILHMKSD